MTDTWQTFSLKRPHGCTLSVSVREPTMNEGLERLRRDDRCWHESGVYWHGAFQFDPAASRLRPKRGFVAYLDKMSVP